MSVDTQATHPSDPLAPAATPTTQGRKRPLRTYSRRSAQPKAQEDEPPSINAGSAATTPSPQRRESPGQPPVLPSDNQAREAERPVRGSILAYFKPLPPSSDRARSDVAPSDAIEPPSTPPTSPLAPSQPRKRRRLTTRPQLGGLGQHENADGGEETLVEHDTAGEGRAQRPCSLSSVETTSLVRGEDRRALRPALSEMAANTVDRQDGSASVLTGETTKTKKRPDKRPAQDMTQTTLSLSIHKEPGFTICGVCDILYNPLNEKDRRDHNRRHAAYSRNKRKVSQ